MNKFIKEQLKKTRVELPDWDDNTTQLIITRGDISTTSDIVINGVYTIKVENYILNPPPTFTLAENWNGGTNPPEEKLNATIIQIMGKMIKVKSSGVTTGIAWEGWLPRKGFTII